MHTSPLKLVTTPEAVIKQALYQADRVPISVCANRPGQHVWPGVVSPLQRASLPLVCANGVGVIPAQVWFHSAAWGIPGVLTILLLALNKVEGDSVSGVCFVGLYDLDALRYFVLAPLCAGVLVGLSLLLAGIVSLNNVRQVIQHDERNLGKLKKFMIRIGVFSTLYLAPLLTLLACYTYEQSQRRGWESTWINDRCQEYSIPCAHQVGPQPGVREREHTVCVCVCVCV